MLKLERDALIVDGAWIDGRRCPSADGRSFAVENPADGSIIAFATECGAAEAKQATDAASNAFCTWRNVLAGDRSRLLRGWFDLVKKNGEDLARLISLEQGKPLAESRSEIAYGAAYIEWFAEQCRRNEGDILPANARGRRVLVLKEPIGVVAAITPWNFPMAMLARKVAPALAAGCTVVAKPSEDTPLSALALAFLAAEAGLPDGVFNVVPASREQAAAVAGEWIGDSRVRKLSFTGSTAVGKLLARDSAATVKRLSLELGGNAPFLVFDDADLDGAVAGAIASKFRNAGQTCVCANRILVQSGIYDRFAAKVAGEVAKLRVGPADAGQAEIGPLINARALDKVERHVADAVSKGAVILAGGNRHPLGRYFFEPTVLANVTGAMSIACEETFGPVAPLFRFETEAEAIEMANSTPFGLAAYFYSQNYQRIWRVAAAIEAGMIGINEGVISTEIAPFGGIKDSGYGREGSPYGLEEYRQLKYLCMGGLG